MLLSNAILESSYCLQFKRPLDKLWRLPAYSVGGPWFEFMKTVERVLIINYDKLVNYSKLSNLKQCIFVKVCLFWHNMVHRHLFGPWFEFMKTVEREYLNLDASEFYLQSLFTPSNKGRLICSCIFAGSLLLHSGFNLKDKTKLNLVFLSIWSTIRISSMVANYDMCDCNEKKHKKIFEEKIQLHNNRWLQGCVPSVVWLGPI